MVTGKRNRTVDIVRGIAMLCIVAGHFGIWNINRVVFTFHVPVFFVITGYFLNRREPLKDFLQKKARTLLVPYILTCIIVILLNTLRRLFMYGASAGVDSFLYWLKAALYGAGDSYTQPFQINAIGAVWFLLAAFWGSIFTRILIDWKPWQRIAGVTVLFAIGYHSRVLFWFPWSIQAGCCAVFYMYIGWLFRTCASYIKEVPSELRNAFSVFSLFVWISFILNFRSFWLVHCDIGRGAADLFGSLCACWCVYRLADLIEHRVEVIAKPLAWLGEYSLFVLCIHLVELDAFPWGMVENRLMGLEYGGRVFLIYMFKLMMIIGGTWIFSRCNPLRKAFGMKPVDQKF